MFPYLFRFVNKLSKSLIITKTQRKFRLCWFRAPYVQCVLVVKNVVLMTRAIDTLSVQNLLASFCCVLERHFTTSSCSPVLASCSRFHSCLNKNFQPNSNVLASSQTLRGIRLTLRGIRLTLRGIRLTLRGIRLTLRGIRLTLRGIDSFPRITPPMFF